MKNIKALAKGEVALRYDGADHNGLSKVLRKAFPLSDQEIPEFKPCRISSFGLEWSVNHGSYSEVLDLSQFLDEIENLVMYKELSGIAIKLLPSLIERAVIPYDHAEIVEQAYKFAKEVVKQGGYASETDKTELLFSIKGKDIAANLADIAVDAYKTKEVRHD